jgi:hypothetical protein
LPKSLQAKAKANLHQIWMAPTREEAHDLLLRQCLNLKIHYTTGSELIVINH